MVYYTVNNMSTDPYVKYFKEVKEIEDKKESIVWNLVMIEQHLEESHDSGACKVLLQIAGDIEDIVRILKIDKNISRIPEVAEELKTINEFTRKFETLVRGRSWFSICRAFDPKTSLDNIKNLEKILKRSTKAPRARRVLGRQRVLVDDEFIADHRNRHVMRKREKDLELKEQMKSIRDKREATNLQNKTLFPDVEHRGKLIIRR